MTKNSFSKLFFTILLLASAFQVGSNNLVNLAPGSRLNDLTCNYDAATGVATIVTTGGDPFLYLEALKSNLPADVCVLSFEYKSSQPVNGMQLFLSPINGNRNDNITSLDECSQWKQYSCTIKRLIKKFAWGKKGDFLRLDVGMQSGATVEIRNLKLRSMNADEKAVQDQLDAKETRNATMNTHLSYYFNKTYASQVKQVNVTTDKVIISGTCVGKGKFSVVEITPYQDITELKHFPYKTHVNKGKFTTTLDRYVDRDGFKYDRVLSKWAIASTVGTKDVLASHGHYADKVTPKRSTEPCPLKSKKGLGGFRVNEYTDDLDKLGITSVTVNIHLNSCVYLNPCDNDIPYTYGGKTYHFDGNRLENLDKSLEACYKRGIIVSAILLIDLKSADPALTDVFKHPDNEGGYYSMPNMTTAEGVNAYAAVMDFLINRYSGSEHGRIHHLIMHNEVDYGIDWTNMGSQPEVRFLDTYVKSMRLCYNIMRQYDQNACILGSYTHNWTAGEKDYKPKLMMEQTRKYGEIEGDFPWGVAYHPYPQDLTAPEFWKDDKESTYSPESKYVTFKNLEVINDWILQKQNFYKNKKRILFLSENGTNSPSYSSSDLALQAAGACWAWKKVEALKGIDAIQWHSWIDNRGEFGLRIGFRRYPDDETDPGGEKDTWRVWQAAGTPQEGEVFAPYLKVIGITDWNQIFHQVQ